MAMATLGPLSTPPRSPSRSAMGRRSWARKIERGCCGVITYFPLVFVYGLTTWAVWVEAGIGMVPAKNAWTGKFTSLLGIAFYILLNWSYTTAVFTDPGSPLNLNKGGYSHLPTYESGDFAEQYTSFTVKGSTGHGRYCKKCQTKKPDRAHHCSTCKRCVLKMDHHCPWLATCVGLHNYKPFLLFLVYVTLFCWICCATSSTWVWAEVMHEGQFSDSFMPINYVLLAVLSGIIGIVITGFTGWHLWLTVKGQTTIESLESTRYLSPVRESMRNQLNDRNYVNAQADGRMSISDRLREIHANALPGVLRPEEGESTPSRGASRSPVPGYVPSSQGQGQSHGFVEERRRDYEERERQQEQDRYDSYLEERDNETLPNAFDLGWRRNLEHVFGPRPMLWPLPICNTSGDGWSWEPSPRWLAARERIKQEREAEERLQKQREREAGWGIESPTEAECRRGGGGVPAGWQVNRFSPPTPRLPRPSDRQAPPRRHGESAQYLTSSPSATYPQRQHQQYGVSQQTPGLGRRSPSKADQILGRGRDMYADGDMQLQPLQPAADRRKFDEYHYISEDEDEHDDDEEGGNDLLGRSQQDSRSAEATTTMVNKAADAAAPGSTATMATKDWNDIPDGFVDERGRLGSGARRGQR